MVSLRATRVLIADGHLLVAEACKHLIEPEFDVIAVVTNGRAAVKAAGELRPDIVILDISMPGLNGLDAGETIKRNCPSTKVIYLTASMGPDVVSGAFRRGASGYVLKQCDAVELLIALRSALRGKSYLSPLITRETVEFLLRPNAESESEKRISPRQREVLQLIAEGKPMKEIAYLLDLKPGTVAFHKYRLMETLGIGNSAALIEYAVKHHLLATQ